MTDEDVCYSDECAEPCASYQARLRAELASYKRQAEESGRRLGEARAELAALRDADRRESQAEAYLNLFYAAKREIEAAYNDIAKIRGVRQKAIRRLSDTVTEVRVLAGDGVMAIKYPRGEGAVK